MVINRDLKRFAVGCGCFLRRGAAFSFICAVAALFAGCNGASEAGGKKKKESVADLPPRTVKTVKVSRVPMERKVTVLGTLVAEEQAVVSAKVAGRMSIVSVDLGTVVKKGQVVAQMERRDYELRVKQVESQIAQARAKLGLPVDGTSDVVDVEKTSGVRQAKAVLSEATKNRERIGKLAEKGISPESERETAEANYEVAVNRYQDAIEEIRNRQAMLMQRRAELDISRQELADTEMHAPFDGVVQERKANSGEYLVVGTPVATIVRIDKLRLRVEVPERDAPGVRAGLMVRLTTEGATNLYTGKIERLSPTINDQNRMLIVEAGVINDGTLRPGTFARADIIVEDQNMALAIPVDALITFAGLEKAIVAQGGRAVERLMSIGRKVEGFVEVLSGLKEGELVVLNPGNLQSGQALIAAAEDALAGDGAKPRTAKAGKKPGGS